MVSNKNGYLFNKADLSIYVPVLKEADKDDLAPTSSAIAHIAVGDAIAMSLKQLNGFSEEKFAKLHPGGLLGKKLNLKVGELSKINEKPRVGSSEKLPNIIFEISSKRLGACCVVDDEDNILGIITDGDIRRLIQRGGDIYKESALDIMTRSAKTIHQSALAIDALQLMKENSITQLIVVDKEEKYIGIVHIHDIIKEGLR